MNMVVLEALLGIFPRLEILVFSPVMAGEGVKSLEAFPHLQEHRSVLDLEESSDVVAPCKREPMRWV